MAGPGLPRIVFESGPKVGRLLGATLDPDGKETLSGVGGSALDGAERHVSARVDFGEHLSIQTKDRRFHQLG
jgi:hypothetical protein